MLSGPDRVGAERRTVLRRNFARRKSLTASEVNAALRQFNKLVHALVEQPNDGSREADHAGDALAVGADKRGRLIGGRRRRRIGERVPRISSRRRSVGERVPSVSHYGITFLRPSGSSITVPLG